MIDGPCPEAESSDIAPRRPRMNGGKGRWSGGLHGYRLGSLVGRFHFLQETGATVRGKQGRLPALTSDGCCSPSSRALALLLKTKPG